MDVGLVNPRLHKLAASIVRDIERPCLDQVNLFLAGSYHIKQRLEFFQQKKLPIEVFYAGIDGEYFDYQGPRSFQQPICVGRHEFPKRPELFIQGMKYLPLLKGKVIGSGGRTAALKKLDTYLTYKYGFRHEEYPTEEVWKKLIFEIDALNLGSYLATAKKYNLHSNVELTGNVGKAQLIREYANALCVVCPAYEEDYGLTAIEAMAFGKSVIACTDGGGYLELIEHGKTGFIVEPTARAIAEAIQYLIDNPEKLRELSDNAYEKSREFSWDRVNTRIRQLVEHIGFL
jgi:glycosyltransferase involved in cell wall biosynthesis